MTCERWSDRWIARLVQEARQAVLDHRADYARDPGSHRGCLYCEDGRLSHWLGDAEQFYCRYEADRTEFDRVEALYRRAYPGGETAYTGPWPRLP